MQQIHSKTDSLKIERPYSSLDDFLENYNLSSKYLDMHKIKQGKLLKMMI
jgi:hypothetical protein